MQFHCANSIPALNSILCSQVETPYDTQLQLNFGGQDMQDEYKEYTVELNN